MPVEIAAARIARQRTHAVVTTPRPPSTAPSSPSAPRQLEEAQLATATAPPLHSRGVFRGIASFAAAAAPAASSGGAPVEAATLRSAGLSSTCRTSSEEEGQVGEGRWSETAVEASHERFRLEDVFSRARAGVWSAGARPPRRPPLPLSAAPSPVGVPEAERGVSGLGIVTCSQDRPEACNCTRLVSMKR